MGYGDGFYISINGRTCHDIWLAALRPGRHRGLEPEGGAGAEEPLRARGPPAAAAGLPAAPLHERGGRQQALELRLPKRRAGRGLQRPVGGAPVPGRAGVLPQLHGAAGDADRTRDEKRLEADVDLVGRGLPRVQQLVRLWGWVHGSDRKGVLPGPKVGETQTGDHHRFLQGEEEEAPALQSIFSAVTTQETQWRITKWSSPLYTST